MFALLPLLLVAGCFQVTDELTIQPDGSGKVLITAKTSAPSEMAQGMAMEGGMMGGGESIYPPLSEGQARKLFPATGCVVIAKSSTAADGGSELTVTAVFKDINALLASPYGKVHALTLKIENGALRVQALTGLEPAARYAEMNMADNPEMAMAFSTMGDMRKKTNEMRSEFRVILPNAVSSSNGAKEGKTASWTAERAKATNSDAFAAQLGQVLEASCPADGLKFTPVSPLRLNLLKFADLLPGPIAAAASGPDPQKAQAAARFVPYSLRVQRSLDLTGNGGGYGGNEATLSGAVVLPSELAPARWGTTKIDEVTDAKGNSLKNDERESGFNYSSYEERVSEMAGADEDEAPPTNLEHAVTFNFKAPGWKTAEVAHFKGSVRLEYFSGSQLVKLTNAIPASWIKEMKGGMDFEALGGDTRRTLNDPALQPLGVSMELQMAMVQAGMTMLGFSVKGNKGGFTQVQVFDADGKAWPTTLQNEGGNAEERSMQIMVSGKPKAPLSIGLVAAGAGGSVDVPIVLDHIPLRNP